MQLDYLAILSAPDAARHGWRIVRAEWCDGVPGYRLQHTSGSTAWMAAHEWLETIRNWDRLYTRPDAAPGELEDAR